MLKTFKFYQNAVKTKPFIVLLLVAGISLLLIPDAYAFSAPLIKTTESVTKHAVALGLTLGLLPIAYFGYTLYMGQPDWKRAFYALVGITVFTAWAYISGWAKGGMN